MILIKFIENARDLSKPKHRGLDSKYKQKHKKSYFHFLWMNKQSNFLSKYWPEKKRRILIIYDDIIEDKINNNKLAAINI